MTIPFPKFKEYSSEIQYKPESMIRKTKILKNKGMKFLLYTANVL